MKSFLILKSVFSIHLEDWADFGDPSFENAMSSEDFIHTYDQDVNPSYFDVQSQELSFSGFFQEARKLGEMAEDPVKFAERHPKKELTLDDFVQVGQENLV